jgi:hypothetical protein
MLLGPLLLGGWGTSNSHSLYHHGIFRHRTDKITRVCCVMQDGDTASTSIMAAATARPLPAGSAALLC